MVSLTNMLPLNSLIVFQMLLTQREIKKVETVHKRSCAPSCTKKRHNDVQKVSVLSCV